LKRDPRRSRFSVLAFKQGPELIKRVAGRLHGTIVSAPEQIDVDVTFSMPIEEPRGRAP
jgi:hypothetical protein